MKLRKLEIKDAPLMLEWMHDETVVKDLKQDFGKKTMADVQSFIASANHDEKNIHLAIASDEDEYMGTVSLKNINRANNSAEFAIVIRSAAMRRGYALFGMKEIIQKAFEEYGLDGIYWCVSRKNLRAVRFYDKHHFHETLDIPSTILQEYAGIEDLKWYSILKGDILDERTEIAGCKIVHIKTISTLEAGELSVFEAMRDIPFECKRTYYISKVPEGMRRGFHAHKKLKQLLYCPYGRIQLILENKFGREEIELSDPSIGVLIEEPTWREMLWLQKDSVLCIAASEYYDPDDYIRDYDEFKRMLE